MCAFVNLETHFKLKQPTFFSEGSRVVQSSEVLKRFLFNPNVGSVIATLRLPKDALSNNNTMHACTGALNIGSK